MKHNKVLKLQVRELIQNHITWTEFICSLSKDDLRDYLNNEDNYKSDAQNYLICEKFYNSLKENYNDGHVHCFVKKKYEGCTERIKEMFIYKDGQIYITYTCGSDRGYNDGKTRYYMGVDHYSLPVNTFSIDEFKTGVIEYVLTNPKYFTSSWDKIYWILGLFAYEELDCLF